MRPLTPWLKWALICIALWAPIVQADEIILNTGERFQSDKVWRENGKIRFNMHGLIVSVNPADVLAIHRDGAGAPPLPAPDHTATAPKPQTRPHDGGVQSTPRVHEPKPKTMPKKKRPPETPQHKPRIRGIGIDGIEWQMRPSHIPGIEKSKTDPAYGGIDQYYRPEGVLRMGDAMLDGLVFGFWQNRLYTITIWVDGEPAYGRLQRAVFHRYGKGRKNKSGVERYVWVEDTTDRMLEFDEKLNTGIFWMRSRELDRYIKQRYPD